MSWFCGGLSLSEVRETDRRVRGVLGEWLDMRPEMLVEIKQSKGVWPEFNVPGKDWAADSSMAIMITPELGSEQVALELRNELDGMSAPPVTRSGQRRSGRSGWHPVGALGVGRAHTHRSERVSSPGHPLAVTTRTWQMPTRCGQRSCMCSTRSCHVGPIRNLCRFWAQRVVGTQGPMPERCHGQQGCMCITWSCDVGIVRNALRWWRHDRASMRHARRTRPGEPRLGQPLQ